MLDKVGGTIVNAIEWILEAILEPLIGLKDLSDLVFGQDLYYLIFTENEWNNLVVEGVGLTITVAYMMVFVGIVYVSYMVSKSAINPQTRTSFLAMCGSLVFVVVLLNNLHFLYEMMMLLNQTLVRLFYMDAQDGGNLQFGDLNSGLGQIFLYMVYLGLSLWANIYYIMRKFTIALLMILGPIFVSLFVFHQFRPVTGSWLRELFATIMVQTIHAAILWMFLMLDDSVTDSFLVKLVILATFIPIAEGVKQLMNMSDGLTGKSAAMAAGAGAIGLASVFSAGKSAMGKSNMFDGMSKRFGGGGREVAGDGAKKGSGTEASGGDSVSKGQPASAKTGRMLQVGRISGNFGKAGGELMGAAAGLGLGPAGVVAGGIMGGGAGKAIGGVAGRGGAASVQAGNKMRHNVNESINDELDKSEQMAGGLQADNLSSYRRNVTSGVKGTGKGIAKTFSLNPSGKGTPADKKKTLISRTGYVGGVVGGEGGVGVGNQLGAGMSKMGGYDQDIEEQGMEVSDLGKSGITEVRVAVTNEGSTVLGKGKGGGEQRLTQFKGGDSSLKQGEVVYKDYQVSHGRIADPPQASTHGDGGGYYKMDSQGGKQYVNKEYNVNPNDYFENRNKGSEKYFRPERSRQGFV